ncbi:MAG: sulfotransferase family protein [Bacteroidota bacterium]
MEDIKTYPTAFLLSSPRSGSTMLRLNLNRVENILTLPETHLFVLMGHYKKRKVNWANKDEKNKLAYNWTVYHSIKKFPLDRKKLHEEIVEKAESWKDVFFITVNQFIEQQHKGRKISLLVEKSPPHIFFVPQIKEMFPDAPLLFLVRDPRDVVASLKSCSWSTSNVYINSKVWRRGVEIMNQCPQKLTIRYEDIVAGPVASVEKICTYCKIEFDREKFVSSSLSDDLESGNITSKNALQPISEKHVASWKTRLSGADLDLQVIEHVCKKEMKALGYIAEGKTPVKGLRKHLFLGSLRQWLG